MALALSPGPRTPSVPELMPSCLRSLLGALCASAATATVHAATSSVASGAWSSAQTWSHGVPVNSSAVGVLNGFTVTFSAGDSWTGGEHPQGLLVGDNGGFASQAALAGSGSGSLRVQGGGLTSGFVGVGCGAVGAVEQSAGTVSTQEIWLGNGSGTGTYTLAGGNLAINRLLRFGVFGSGTGIFNHDGGLAEIASVTAWTDVTGVYRLRGGSLRALGDLSFTGFGANIALEITGALGDVTLDTNGRSITAVSTSVFDNPAATLRKTGAGTLLFSGSQLQVQNGALSVDQGTLETHSSLVIGQNGGAASLALSGGSLRFGYPQAANFIVGLAGGSGSVTQGGGSLETGSQTYALGWSGTGSHHLLAGSVKLGTGTAFVGLGSGGAGDLRISGGSFAAGSLQVAVAGAKGTVRLEGGSLALSGPLTLGPGAALLLDGASAGATGFTWTSGARVRFGASAASFHRLNLDTAQALSIPPGANLELNPPSSAPAVGSRHFLINNAGAGGLGGRFAAVNGRSLPLDEAATFELNGVYYRIGYGGDFSANTFTGGNDLVLEVAAPPAGRATQSWTFESPSLAPWSAQDWSGGAPAKISAVSSNQSPLSGARSARVSIAATHQPAQAEVWHLVFTTDVPVTAGRYYHGGLTLRADRELSFEIFVQRSDVPYSTFVARTVTVGTTPITVHFGGMANFTTVPGDASTMGRLLLALGRVPAGAQIWLDDITFTEAPLAPSNATVSVNFDQPLAAPSLSGFLLGLDVNNLSTGNPPAHRVTPLRPKYWRVRSEWTGRVAAYGAVPIVVCSEGLYPPAPAPWSDGYASWRAHATTLAQTHGTSVVYDIWNEPDIGVFFTNWPDATFARFLETFKEAHDAIRAVVPDAVISGPSLAASYCPYRLRQFMDYCRAHNLRVQVLSLHMLERDDGDFDRMETDIAQVRADFITNPDYAPVGVQEIHVNEYGAPGDQSYRPGSILAFLRAMESVGVAAACRSCWDHPDAPGVNSGFDGTLDGLLTRDTFQPRAVWWAYRWYAEGEGHRVFTSGDNPDLVALASGQAGGPAAAQILLASHGSRGAARALQDVTIQLTQLHSLPFVAPGATRVTARVESVSFTGLGTGAVPQPRVLVDVLPLDINGGSASLSLGAISPYDALRITLHPANSPPQIFPATSPLVTMDEDAHPRAWSAPALGATDPDGDTLTWSLASPPSSGTATVSGVGPSPSVLNYQPAANFHGEDSFVVRVSDGRGGIAERTLLVSVVSDGIPEAWETQHNITLASADKDGDGLSNLAEFVFGTDPSDPRSRFETSLSHVASPEGPVLVVEFPTSVGRTYFVERSPDLAAGSWTIIATVDGTDVPHTHVEPLSGSPRRFLRVRAVLSPP